MTVATNALGQMPFQANYDYGTGQPVLTADIRGQYTNRSYGTSGYGLDRLTEVVQPTGAQTNILYEAPTWTITYQDQNTPGDRALQSQSVYDGLGRILEQRTLEGGSTGTLIAVDTAYDALGRGGLDVESEPGHDVELVQRWIGLRNALRIRFAGPDYVGAGPGRR